MGCRISKPVGEPCTIIIKLPIGCGKLSRSFSDPSQLADEEHVFEVPDDTFHSVSLTSSTYGSLRLDSMRSYGEERRRRLSNDSLKNVRSENLRSGGNLPVAEGTHPWSQETDSSWRRNNEKGEQLIAKQVEIINMLELMEGIEDEKAGLELLRSLVESPRMSGYHSGKSTPRIHTVEDVDTVLDARSLPRDYFSRRAAVVPSRQSDETEKVIGRNTALLQKRRARAIQISKDVVQELDELRRRNLSRSQDFNISGRKVIRRSQEFNASGRRDLSWSQESNTDVLGSHESNNRSRSQDFDSIGRFKHIRSPVLHPDRRGRLLENDLRNSADAVRSESFALPSLAKGNDIRNRADAARSQSFALPPVTKPKEVVDDHEIPRTTRVKNGRVYALTKPDIVLRSPLLDSARGHERLKVRTSQDSSTLRGQAHPSAERKSTQVEVAGPTRVSFDLNE